MLYHAAICDGVGETFLGLRHSGCRNRSRADREDEQAQERCNVIGDVVNTAFTCELSDLKRELRGVDPPLVAGGPGEAMPLFNACTVPDKSEVTAALVANFMGERSVSSH
jgi:hypothetical protein